MTSSTGSLSPAWQEALSTIERRKNSPVLLPMAVGALVSLFEAGQTQDGCIRFTDFERATRDLAKTKGVALKSGPWMPYAVLAGQLGVLQCLSISGDQPVNLQGPSRPKGRKALLAQTETARVTESLAGDLCSSTARSTLSQWVDRMTAASRQPTSSQD